MQVRQIDRITIGPRYRRDMGDLDALARSIADVGLLHPVIITRYDEMIAGVRRLKACQLLGWTEIPVHVVDLEAIVRGEFAENAIRKDFLPSEAVAIASALRPVEQAAAKERQRAAGGSAPGKLPQPAAGRSRDKVAAFAGIGARSLDKATAIVAAAEAEPERFASLVADMDRTGRVDGPFKRLKVMKQAEAIRHEPPPLPQRGPYRVIVADPPWPYEIRKEDPSHRATHPYPPMSIDQIRAMPVAGLAHEDCILWLWTTNHHMREAFTVLDAWGFEHKTILTWAKARIGTGYWNRNQHELLLVGSRGNIPAPAPGTQWPSVIEAPVDAHSAKPPRPRSGRRRCPAQGLSSSTCSSGPKAPRRGDRRHGLAGSHRPRRHGRSPQEEARADDRVGEGRRPRARVPNRSVAPSQLRK